MTHQVSAEEIAGFDLIGFRQPDGTILLGTNEIPMSDFPAEAEILGQVYTLENVVLNDANGDMPDDHPGKNIEWGQYV